MLTPSLRAFVTVVVNYARHSEADRVVTALLTESGQVVYGRLTPQHISDSCVASAVLTQHVEADAGGRVVAVVMVRGGTGDVQAPCGVCRQVLFDHDPNITCVVRGRGGYKALPVVDLLPYVPDHRVTDGVQRISMWYGYAPAIREGRKRQTIRVDDPFRLGPAVVVFAGGGDQEEPLSVEVTAVVHTTREHLTDADAQRDGFADLPELQAALARHYPGLAPDAPVDIVTFEVCQT